MIDKRKLASEILTDLRFKKGLQRKWLAQQIGCNPLYVSFAASDVKKKNGVSYCPMYVVDKVLEIWGDK